MKYLFDISAIFRAIKENKIDFLTGNYTLELSRSGVTALIVVAGLLVYFKKHKR